MASGEKPSVVIVGGLGFMGRFLALHLHENNLASEVRLVDKVLPQLAWLAPEFEPATKDKFVQADASREQSFPRIFDRAGGQEFDYVINCGGETRHSQPDDVYRIRSLALSVALGKESARRGIKAFIECSTAAVYKSGSEPSKEDGKLKPQHTLAKWKLQAEEDLRQIPGLNLTILRFPHVYGEYDSGYLSTGICIARVFKELQKELGMLYHKNLGQNSVYVKDAVRALWTAAEWRASKGPVPAGDPSVPVVFNIVDHNDTRQVHLAEAMSIVFESPYTFVGSMMSQFAKLNMDEVIDEINEETLEVWSDLIREKNIQRPGPISPFLEKESLKDSEICVDGGLFERTTGFQYQRERFDVSAVRDIIASYERMGWWP